MRSKKGCINPECEVYKNKKYFKDSEIICPSCGSKLVEVCQNKKCYKPVYPGHKYCQIHEAESSDKRDGVIDVLKVVGSAVGQIAVGIVLQNLFKDKINIPTNLFKKN